MYPQCEEIILLYGNLGYYIQVWVQHFKAT